MPPFFLEEWMKREYLIECFEYNPDTGILIWKERPRHHFQTLQAWSRWNTMYAGKRAGCKGDQGYRVVFLDGKRRKEHRLIWLIAYGDPVPDEIDHDNNIRDDNRLINLVASSDTHNVKNQRRRKNNTSGVNGVYETRNGKWRASIRVNNRLHNLGTFPSKTDAISARKEAEKGLGFHADHGGERE